MNQIRKYPRGATHCVDPNAMDEMFYRRKGKVLEYFSMGRGEWFVSPKPPSYLAQLHRLNIE